MDTPLHAAAIPDADRATLKDPATSARELIRLIDDLLAKTPAVAAAHAHKADR